MNTVWSWALVLVPVDAARTRRLIRMRVSYQPAAKWAPSFWLLMELADFVRGRRQLPGIRQRADATGQQPRDRSRPGAIPRTWRQLQAINTPRLGAPRTCRGVGLGGRGAGCG
jgi:hypothetical protein